MLMYEPGATAFPGSKLAALTIPPSGIVGCGRAVPSNGMTNPATLAVNSWQPKVKQGCGPSTGIAVAMPYWLVLASADLSVPPPDVTAQVTLAPGIGSPKS